MTTSELATRGEDAAIIEQVVIGGDLSKLTPPQRVNYYRQVCSSLGLNPLTKPFDYITLNGKLTLYARKDAADQLRQLHGISIDKPDIHFEDDWIIVTVVASDKDGRTDSDIGVVKKTDMQGNMGNALMKAVTKAKRRVTLSICGLGMLDETEIESIPAARPVTVVPETGEIIEPEPVKSNGHDHQPGMVEAGQQLGGVVKLEPGTLEWAYTFKTSAGKAYGDLTEDELQAVIDHPKAPAERKQAAKMILASHDYHNGDIAGAEMADDGLDPRDGMPFGDK